MFSKRAAFVFLSFFFTVTAFAQTGSWSLVNGRGTFNDKWSTFGEAQLRSWKFYDHFFYYEIKAAVNYNITKNFAVTAGLGTYHTYQTSGNFKLPVTNNETRTWLQMTINDRFGRLNIDHRYRIEQRFTSSGYRNRFRYRLNTIVPLNHKELKDRTFFLTAFDEVFFTNKRPYFERNRLFGGAGFRFHKNLTVQAGYLNQFDYNLSRSLNKGFLQTSLLVGTNFKKAKPVREARHETID